MIPKIIHYCWFGGNPLPELAQKCIASWKKYCPDYEIKEWNESNYDVHKIPYISEAYNVKKYAFVSDYARCDVLYNYGGIYLDVDVELLKPFDDDMLKNKCFSGFEFTGRDYKTLVNPGLVFAGEKGCEIIKELMTFYSKISFIKENGELNSVTIPEIFTNILLKYGLKQKNTYQELEIFTAYPTEYFCPKSVWTGFTKITPNTASIHHYDGSWMSVNDAKYLKKIHKIYYIFGDNIMSRFFINCDAFLTKLSNLANLFFVKLGPIGTFKYYWGNIVRKNNVGRVRL
jgi:hypothetical protein